MFSIPSATLFHFLHFVFRKDFRMASETEPQLTAVGWHPVCLIVDYNAFWFLCLIFLRTLLFWIYQIKFNLEFDLRCRAFRPVTWCKIKTPPQAGRMSRLLYFTLERDSDFYFFFFLIKLYRMYSEIIFMDLSYIAVLMMCCMLLSVRFNIYIYFFTCTLNKY